MTARQRPTLAGSFPPTTLGVKNLNFCVRHGNRCFLLAFATVLFLELLHSKLNIISTSSELSFWSSSRLISTGPLQASLLFHSRPIYLIVSKVSYCFRFGNLILRGASHLDAFSAYPFHT